MSQTDNNKSPQTHHRFNLRGVNIDNVSFNEAIERIGQMMENDQKAYMVTPNVAHVVDLQTDDIFRRAYDRASLVVADGLPLLWTARWCGQPLKERVAGSDLFYHICRLAAEKKKRLFILGGTETINQKAGKKLQLMLPDIKLTFYSPPFGFEKNLSENDKIIRMIREFETEVLLVCVGTPKSEKWLYQNIDRLSFNMAASLGASLEFFLGVKKRSPLWIQKVGLEWFWRLIHEPRRLWKRYLVGNSKFVCLAAGEIINARRRRKQVPRD